MTDAKQTTLDLGGKWLARYGCAPCPVCQPERRRDQTALTLSDGRNGLLANCKKSNCDFRSILAAAGVTPGSYTPPDPAVIAQRRAEERAQAERKSQQARRCWDESLPIGGTLAETYLRNRGIRCDLPASLRYHPECWHGPTARRHPAMVAMVEGADGCAIHRTYLRADGTGKAGLDGGDKLMLGCTRGGAVTLTQAHNTIVVCEGVETGLALASGLLRRPATVIAALSTSGIRSLILPPSPGRITVATDGDDAGRAAGRDLAERAHATGWAVSLLPAPDGRDWCDVLIGKEMMA